MELEHVLEQVKVAALAIWDKKGFEVVALRVREIVQYTDFLIIASATSDRHAAAIADHVEAMLHEKLGQKPIGTEGRTQGRWVLLDYSDFVVHVFHRPVRDYYDIERLYGDAPHVDLEEPAWVKEISPDAMVEQGFDYGDQLWMDAPDESLDDELDDDDDMDDDEDLEGEFADDDDELFDEDDPEGAQIAVAVDPLVAEREAVAPKRKRPVA